MTKAKSASAGPSRSIEDLHTFSVIVPVYEQWQLVPALLECMVRQTLPPSLFEVLLVDNGSVSFTPPDALPQNSRILQCTTPGSYAARNLAARRARGTWLAFTDADCLPDAQWLETLREEVTRSSGGRLLAGAVTVIPGSSIPNAFEMYDMARGIPQARYVHRGYAATANLAVSRAVFQRVGGFDGARFSGGDADFCRRAGAMGYPIVFVPEARVDHPARATWHEIATKARRVKGGQLTAGTRSRRMLWVLMTLVPPIRDAWRFFRTASLPIRYRLTAVGILFRVWLTELRELVRLLGGGLAERR